MRFHKRIAAAVLVGGTFVLSAIGDPGPEVMLQKKGTEFQEQLDAGQVRIEPVELLDLMHDRTVRLRIFDIRDEGEWNWFHLVDAERVPEVRWDSWGRDLDFDEIVIVVDQDGSHADDAWRRLQARDISNSYVLDGGLDAWLHEYGHGFHPAAALGDRHPAALPDVHEKLEYTARVRRVGKAPVLTGGCG